VFNLFKEVEKVKKEIKNLHTIVNEFGIKINSIQQDKVNADTENSPTDPQELKKEVMQHLLDGNKYFQEKDYLKAIE